MSPAKTLPEPSLYDFVCKSLASVTVDEGIAGLIGRTIGGASRDKPPWWFVTDLVNPSLAYYREISSPIPTDPALAQRLRFGKAIHGLAESWFRNLDGFATSEGTVDGAHVGLAGVRGKIDFRIGDSIIELKTTQLEFITVEDVVERFPHDLEQLILYILFTNREAEDHWLVFYRAGVEPPFLAYRVRLIHPGPLKHMFEQRLKILDEALAAHSSSRLGRCRYLESGCDYDLQSVCDCRARGQLSGELIQESVRLYRDTEFEASLDRARQEARQRGPAGLTLWDLVVPRQTFLKSVGAGIAYFSDDDDRDAVRRQLQERLRAADVSAHLAPLNLDGITLGWGETITLNETTREGHVRNSYPVMVKASSASTPFRRENIPPAYIVQLGIRCAVMGFDTGILVLGYSTHPGLFACYRIRYKGREGMLAEVRRALRDIGWAVANRDPSHLPPCEEWLRSSCSEACLCREPRLRV